MSRKEKNLEKWDINKAEAQEIDDREKKKAEKNKGGRPCSYDPVMGKKICDMLSVSHDGITLICKNNPGLPSVSTTKYWRNTVPEFADLYEAAKLKQALNFAEDIIDISDILIDPFITTDKGVVPNPMSVQHARLRIDTRKWIACKLLPKVYGDKMQQEVTIVTHEEALKQLE